MTTHTITTLSLLPGSVLSLRNMRDACVAVHAGRIWLTCTGDARDHFLDPGQWHEVGSTAHLVLQCLGQQPAQVELRGRAVDVHATGVVA